MTDFNNSKVWIDIKGGIIVDVTHDEFINEFNKWLDTKNWTFLGTTTEENNA